MKEHTIQAVSRLLADGFKLKIRPARERGNFRVDIGREAQGYARYGYGADLDEAVQNAVNAPPRDPVPLGAEDP